MNKRLPISLLGAAGLYAASILTFAADAAAPDIGELLKSGEILSQEAIIKRAAEEHPCKVTETELERKGGRYVYEVNVVDDRGVKTELKFDAHSGELLSRKIDDDDDQAKNNPRDDDDDDN
jgi:peptidase YpeB-like protein